MRDWIIPEFEALTYDAALFDEYAKLQRFKMTEKSKHGWYINARDTTALDNMLIEVYRFDGVRKIRKDGVSTSWVRYHQDINWNGEPYTEYEHEGTLFGYNRAFKLNAKTRNFLNKLSKCDRFTQSCILNERPFNINSYDFWVRTVELDRQFDRPYF